MTPPSDVKPGTVKHALWLLANDCIVEEGDLRFSSSVIDALERRHHREVAASKAFKWRRRCVNMGVRYPNKIDPVRWFWAS